MYESAKSTVFYNAMHRILSLLRHSNISLSSGTLINVYQILLTNRLIPLQYLYKEKPEDRRNSFLMILSSRIIRNLASVFIGDLSSKVIAMLLTIFLARYLEPAQYGIYSFVTSILFIFLVISDFGLNDLIIRDIARSKALANQYFKAAVIIKALVGMLCIFVMIMSVNLMGYSYDKVIYTAIISLSIFFICLNNTIISFFKAFERMEYSSLLSILGNLFIFISCIVLIFLKGSLKEIIIARVVSLSAISLLGFLLLRRFIEKIDVPIDLGFIKMLFHGAFPFLANGLIHSLYCSLDIIMLSKMKGDLCVGWFSPAANDLFFSLFIIPGTISTVVYPIFSRQYMNSTERLIRSCNFCIKILAIIGIAISVGTFLLSSDIINLIYGPKYFHSIAVLKIIAVAIIFTFVRDPLGYALAATGEVQTLMRINLAMLILNAILNLILIPLYAHIGAAITTTLCIIISLPISQYILNRKIGSIVIARNLVKPIIAATFMSVAIYALNAAHFHLIFVILFAALIYGAALLLLKTFDKNEFDMLKGLFLMR